MSVENEHAVIERVDAMQDQVERVGLDLVEGVGPDICLTVPVPVRVLIVALVIGKLVVTASRRNDQRNQPTVHAARFFKHCASRAFTHLARETTATTRTFVSDQPQLITTNLHER